MKFSIFILVSLALAGESFSQVASITSSVRSKITSFDISPDGRYAIITDEKQDLTVFDIQRRGFVAPEGGKIPPEEKKYLTTPKMSRKFKVRIERSAVIIESNDGTPALSYDLKERDYDYGYSFTGKYFLIIQSDIFYNQSDAGIKVINLETGKPILDAYSYVKNKQLEQSINQGIPSPFSSAGISGSVVKYTGTSAGVIGDTTLWKYSKNGKKGVYKQFPTFDPAFAQFNNAETRILITGSQMFRLVNLESGAELFRKTDGCRLAKFTPDGKLIVSAYGNLLAFYDASNGKLLFTSTGKTDSKSPVNSKSNEGAFNDLAEMAKRNLEKTGSPQARASLDQSLQRLNKLSPKEKEKATKMMDSVLGSLAGIGDAALRAPYERIGVIPPNSKEMESIKYVEVREGNYNAKGTHLIIGYSVFEGHHISQDDIDHTLNTVYYTILNLNTGKLIHNPTLKESKIAHAAFSKTGNLLMVGYLKHGLLPGYVKSTLEVWDLDKNVVKYSITESKVLPQPEHDCFFSDDGKYMLIVNNWHVEKELEAEIYNAQTGAKLSYARIPIGYDDNYYTLKLLFLPEANIVVKYYDRRKDVSIFDLKTGRPLVSGHAVFEKAEHFRLSVNYDQSHLYFNNTGYMEGEPSVIAWDLKRRVFMGDSNPFAKLAKKSGWIKDKNGSFSILNGQDGLEIYDNRDTLINTLRMEYPIFINPGITYRVTGDSLYFVTADEYSKEFSVVKVEKFGVATGYKFKRLGILRYKYASSITGNNISKNVFAAADSGDLRFYSLQNGKSICKLRLIDEQNYIIWNEKNEYMSSTNLLTKRFKGIEQFEIEKNRPDIILQTLGSSDRDLIGKLASAREERIERNKDAGETSSKNNRLPVSAPLVTIKPISDSITTTKKKLIVQIEATDAQVNLRKVRVWVKNTPLFGISGLDISKTKSKRFSDTVSIELSEGDNIIEFAAENEAGIQSSTEYTNITYTADRAVRPKLFFIGAGISRYNSKKLDDLHYAVKDVTDVANLFTEKYSGAVVNTFINDAATRKNILGSKNKLVDCGVDDIVIVYLSGHGVMDPVSNAWRFATYGTGNSSNESGMSFEEIESIIDKIPARKKLLVIDACWSGEQPRKITVKNGPRTIERTTDENTSPSFLKSGNNIEIIDPEFEIFDLMFESFSDLSKGSGAHVIVSSKGNQKSREYPELQHGLLTHFVIKKLDEKKNEANAPPLSILEFRNYIIDETVKYSKGAQQPATRRENFEFNWVIW